MVLFPGPPAVPALVEDPELDDKQPDASPATVMPIRAVSPAFRFNIPAPPQRVGGFFGPRLTSHAKVTGFHRSPTVGPGVVQTRRRSPVVCPSLSPNTRSVTSAIALQIFAEL
ncbi:hypothetical protein GCM10028802_18320 [Terrabacter terrigena]